MLKDLTYWSSKTFKKSEKAKFQVSFLNFFFEIHDCLANLLKHLTKENEEDKS